MLALDEICDNGIILEADPATLVARVALRADDIPLGEQTVAQVGSRYTLGEQTVAQVGSRYTIGEQTVAQVGSRYTLGEQTLAQVGSRYTLRSSGGVA